MAYQVEHAIDIDGPAAVVWGVIQNPALRVRWHARVRSARAVDDRPPGPGHRIEVVLNLGCVPIRSVMEYVVWAPPTKSALRSIGRDVFRSRTAGSWHFRQDSRGLDHAAVVQRERACLRTSRRAIVRAPLRETDTPEAAQLETADRTRVLASGGRRCGH